MKSEIVGQRPTITGGNNFLYNAGSELNKTTSNYEMFFREYDPALGRMTSVDPVAGKYSSLSPYNYAFNDPVTYNDPLGDDPFARVSLWDVVKSRTGGGGQDDGPQDAHAGAGQTLYGSSYGAVIRDGNTFTILWTRVSEFGGAWNFNYGYQDFNSNEEALFVGMYLVEKTNSWRYTQWGSASATWAYYEASQSMLNPDYGSMCACLDGNSFQNFSGVGNKHLKRDFKSMYVSQIKSLVKNLRISREGEPGYDPDILPNPHYYPRKLAKEFAKISRPKLIDKEGNTLVLSRAYVSIGYIQLQSAKNPYGLSHPFSQHYNFEFDYIPYSDFNQKEVRNPGINKSFSLKGSGGHVYWFDLFFKIQ